jgi:hypothetical protein
MNTPQLLLVIEDQRSCSHAHCGRSPLPRVSKALGEDPQNTRERPTGEAAHGEEAFLECQISCILGEAFPECHAPPRWRFNAVSRIFFTLPRVQHSGEKFVFLEILFPECPCAGTRGSTLAFFFKMSFPEDQRSCSHAGIPSGLVSKVILNKVWAKHW